MITININGIDRTNEVEWDSLLIEQNIDNKVDTCSFVYKKFGARTYFPDVGDDIIVFDGVNRIFAGEIIEFQDSVEGVNTLVYNIQCKDWSHQFNRLLVAETYENVEASAIVEDIVNNFTDATLNFTHTNVNSTGINVEYVQFDYTRPTDAIDQIAGMVGFDWYIDYNKDVHFFARGSVSAPFDLFDDTESHEYRTLTLQKSNKEIRNVIYVIGSDYVGATVRDKIGVGDGVQKRFPLPYKYDSLPTFYVNNVSQSAGLENIDQPGTKDAYWNLNEKIVVFETAPASGDIEVEGDPLVPLFIKEKGVDTSRGEFEFKIVDKTLKTEDAVRKRAKVELDTYASDLQDAAFETRKPGLEVGQTIRVNSSLRGIVNEKYVINTITITMHSPNQARYNVALINTKAYTMVNFFRDLLRTGEKAVGSSINATTILNLIAKFLEEITLDEDMQINKFLHDFFENVTVEETLQVQKDFENDWVWGEYEPTSLSDPKRTPKWDRGAKWN